MTRLYRASALIALPILLAACATTKVETLAETPIVIPPRPAAPAGAFGEIVLPPRTADGGFVTPNRDLPAMDATWHLRAALNVAALRCTGNEAAVIASRYNALLRTQKTVFAKAYAAIRARYRAADARNWQTSFDVDQTRLYNFFAQPAVKPEFCAKAAEVASQAGGIAPAGFVAFAAITWPALDAPFTAFYAAYDSYRIAAADWDARYGTLPAAAPPTVTAALN